MKLRFERLIVDTEPQHCLFTSEPYVVFTRAGFTVAADVLIRKPHQSIERSVLIAPQSLSTPLMDRIASNSFRLTGIEVWIYKDGQERTARYRVED